MLQKRFFLVVAALVSVSLVLIGCPTDAETGAAGAPGSVGPAAPIYLSGNLTTAGINDALASGAPLVFAGVVQSDAGTVVIPADRGVKLVGEAAYTTESSADGVLVVEALSSVTGDGALAAGSGGTVIAPSGVKTSAGTTPVVIQEPGVKIVPAATFAVSGRDITIGSEAASATNINATALGTNKLYVVDGGVTVSAALGAATITVLHGNVTVGTADQTAAVVWDIRGDLDAKKLPTKGAGTLTVSGKADFAEEVADITGAITIGGDATFADDLTTGGAVTVGGTLDVEGAVSLGGDLTVGGAAAFGSTLANTTSAKIKAGTVTVAGTVTTAAVLEITAGLTTFEKAVGIATGAATFNGKVVFKDDLTLTAVGATFGDAAFFADGKKISLSAVTSVITLKPGAGLAHGDATKIPTAYSAILGNIDEDDEVKLTPSAALTLTFGANGTKSVTQAGESDHGIKIEGKAALIASATYTVASASSKVGTLELDTDAVLRIDDGTLLTGAPTGYDNTNTSAKLVLTADASNGAILKGVGTVVAGGTEITGGNASGTWTAGGATGTVAIAVDKITGNAASVAFTAGGHADAAITVAEATLEVDAAAVTLASSLGKVVLKGNTEAAKIGKLLLKGGANAGTLVVDSTALTATVTTTGKTVALYVSTATADTDGTITGGVIKAGNASADTAEALGSVAGGAADNDALISAPNTANNTTIANGAYVKTTDA